MDAEPEIAVIKPDMYAVNEDGDKPDKKEFCITHGIQYVVLKEHQKKDYPSVRVQICAASNEQERWILMYYALIMAGGSGTRLWPRSRRSSPKQALKLVGERTMIQHAVDRIVPLFGSQRISVVTVASTGLFLLSKRLIFYRKTLLLNRRTRYCTGCWIGRNTFDQA